VQIRRGAGSAAAVRSLVADLGAGRVDLARKEAARADTARCRLVSGGTVPSGGSKCGACVSGGGACESGEERRRHMQIRRGAGSAVAVRSATADLGAGHASGVMVRLLAAQL
jgi:hypothetical protein